MDEKLLNALSNLSDALTQISDALSEKRSDKDSDVSKALVEGGISDQIKGINEGIKSIKDDTSKILSNQNTIMGMAKSKGDKDDLAAKVGGDKNKQSMIKDGLGVILLMAVAIVALGAAFKLIGDVDFGSVIALGIVIPILALSFVEFQKRIKEIQFDPIKDGFVFILTVTAISLAIVAASYILSMVQPIGLPQLLTTVFIAGAFAAISLTIGKLISGFKDISVTDALKASLLMPLVLPALALAIVGSSYILQAVKPVGLFQLLTTVFIALTFAALGFAIGNIIKSFKDIDPVAALAAVVLMPFLFTGLSLTIVATSYILSMVKPVGIFQLLTALVISAIFVPLSFSVGLIVKSLKDIDLFTAITVVESLPFIMISMAFAVAATSYLFSAVSPISFSQFLTSVGISVLFIAFAFSINLIVKQLKGISEDDLIDLGIIMVGMSAIVMISSHILSASADIGIGKLFSLLFMGVTISVITVALGAAMVLLNKMGSPKDFVMGGVAVLIIATTIMLSSLIIGLGNYGNYPDVGWSLGVGLSMFSFGISVLALGLLISLTGGAGLGFMALGGVAVLMIATTIMLSSLILGLGNYGNYPGVGWSLSVGLSMFSFGISVLGLGLVIALTGGAGLGLMALGGVAVLMIATTIVATSLILGLGNYGNYPGVGWSLGVGMSILAFGLPLMTLGTMILASFGLGLLSITTGSVALLLIAGTIVLVSKILSGGDYNSSYPSTDWIDGVKSSIESFGEINVDFSFLKSGELILQALSIRVVAEIFSENPDIWKSYPSTDWIDGVKSSIESFGEINVDFSFLKSGKLILQALSIRAVAEILSGDQNIWKSYPSTDWIDGVKSSIEGFNSINTGEGLLSSLINNSSIEETADSIRHIAQIFSENPDIWKSYPSTDWVGGVRTAIEGMANLIGDDKIMSKFKGGGFLGMGSSPIDDMANGMYKMASAYDVLGKSISKFNSSLNQMDLEKVSQFRMLTGNIAILSAMDSEMFNDILDTLEERSSVFAELLEIQYEENKSESKQNVGDVKNKPSSKKNKDGKTPEDLIIDRLNSMIKLLKNIHKNSDDIETILTSKSTEKKSLNS
jgi:hypothetical protein